jgi:catechol 2,3-dioxygenase-like lactoylglutathione lyase family enzyme
MFTGLMATLSISDESAAAEWYVRLFERQPDARPMPGLTEWRFAETFGIQLWEDPARAGGSTVVVDVSDLNATAERLSKAGIDHGEPSPGGGQRILPVSDPDGNQVVFFGE